MLYLLSANKDTLKRRRKLFIKCNDILLFEYIKKTTVGESLRDGLFFVITMPRLNSAQNRKKTEDGNRREKW